MMEGEDIFNRKWGSSGQEAGCQKILYDVRGY